MKKFLLSALLALSSLTGVQAANLYSSNLGNGLSTLGSSSGIPDGTVRFGVFPPGFNFAANAENYAALDAAFTEVYAFSGALSVNATNGFYQTAHTYDATASFEGTPYATIAGQPVYVWILNTTTPSLATQQAIFSTSSVWVSPTAVIQDTIVSPDTGVAGLAVHLGALANGSNIGAGAPSHTTSGAAIVVANVVVTRNPATAQVLEGASVTFTATVGQGTFPYTYQWRRNGVNIPGATASTYTLDSALVGDFGGYDVLVSNSVSTNVASNVSALSVVTPTPTIITQPESTVVAVGATLNLEVEAVAAGALQIQWKKGSDLPGMTGAILTLNNMSLAQAGTYTAALSSPGGKLLSDPAEVVVVDQAPETVVAGVNGTVTLKAIVAGKNATYQWFRGMTKIFNTPKFSGATTPTLTVKTLGLFDSSIYYCVVTLNGTSVNSGFRTVKVFNAQPEIDLTGLPMPNGTVGATYTFQIPVVVTASKAPTTYAVTGALPAGVKLDSKTGLFSGRPTKTGTFNLTLLASNVFGTATSPPQTVVISGFPTGLEGSYVGTVDRQPVLGGELGGKFEMTVSNLGAVSGKLYLGTGTLPLVGFIEADQVPVKATFTVQRSGGLPPLMLSFELEGDNYMINGLITDGVSDLNFDGWRNIWTKTTTASAFAGLYNAAIGLDVGSPEDTDQTIPQGAGYSTFTVGVDGKLSYKGKTADGEGITGSTILGPDGEVFFYNTLYKTPAKGSLLAEIFIADAPANADNTLLGAGTWSRPFDPAAAQKLYKAGFGPVDVVVLGGRYTPPVAPLVAFGLAAGATRVLSFEDGGISGAVPDPAATLIIQAASAVTVQGANPALTSIKITPATGIFTGGFTLTDGRKAVIEGIIAPENGVLIGLGNFLLPGAAAGPTLSGLTEITAP